MYSPKIHCLTESNNILLNFVSENNCYINDVISNETCSYMVADLYHAINDMKDKKMNELNIYLNSPGGDVNTLLSILNCLQIAKDNGIKINTYVTGEAASSASIIAVFGDERYIYEYGRHFVHFGSIKSKITKETEINKAYKDTKEHLKFMQEMYLIYTNIPKEKLNALMEDEYGYLSAKDCKKYGFVDKIIGVLK